MFTRHNSNHRLTFGAAHSSSTPSFDPADTLGGVADEVIKNKMKVQATLQSQDAISIDELRQCDNLNPYKDWFVQVLEDMQALQSSIGVDFMDEIEQLAMNKERIADMLNQNQELELQLAVVQDELEETGGGRKATSNNTSFEHKKGQPRMSMMKESQSIKHLFGNKEQHPLLDSSDMGENSALLALQAREEHDNQ